MTTPASTMSSSATPTGSAKARPTSNDLSKEGYLRLKKESKKQRRERRQRERERRSAGLFLSDAEFNDYYEWCVKKCRKSKSGVRASWDVARFWGC